MKSYAFITALRTGAEMRVDPPSILRREASSEKSKPALAAPSPSHPCKKRKDEPPATPAHIWQRRFYDYNVWTQHKRVEKLRYIHRNPVRRGLVEKPEQWRWSSFRDYAYDEPGPVRVNGWAVLKMKIRAV